MVRSPSVNGGMLRSFRFPDRYVDATFFGGVSFFSTFLLFDTKKRRFTRKEYYAEQYSYSQSVDECIILDFLTA